MSICGNCHYNWHSDEECNYDCTFEDAVYREQMAYDSLRESFEDIVDKYNKLIEWCQSGGYSLPFFLEPYTQEESEKRDALPPMFWTRRDWLAYEEENRVRIEAAKTLDQIVDIWVDTGEVYPITAEELAAANKILEEENNDN